MGHWTYWVCGTICMVIGTFIGFCLCALLTTGKKCDEELKDGLKIKTLH